MEYKTAAEEGSVSSIEWSSIDEVAQWPIGLLACRDDGCSGVRLWHGMQPSYVFVHETARHLDERKLQHLWDCVDKVVADLGERAGAPALFVDVCKAQTLSAPLLCAAQAPVLQRCRSVTFAVSTSVQQDHARLWSDDVEVGPHIDVVDDRTTLFARMQGCGTTPPLHPPPGSSMLQRKLQGSTRFCA